MCRIEGVDDTPSISRSIFGTNLALFRQSPPCLVMKWLGFWRRRRPGLEGPAVACWRARSELGPSGGARHEIQFGQVEAIGAPPLLRFAWSFRPPLQGGGELSSSAGSWVPER